MEINIQDEVCWVCGGKKGITSHHALPKHLKPKKNIKLPICSDCHKKINSLDLQGLFAYAHKISLTSAETKNATHRLRAMLDDFIKAKQLSDKK